MCGRMVEDWYGSMVWCEIVWEIEHRGLENREDEILNNEEEEGAGEAER